MMQINTTKIPWQVIYIIHNIEQKRYKAYLVGGAVRDLLLGLTPHDYDIATNAPLEVLQSIFGNNIKVVGASFGVVLLSIEGMNIQIARFRNDGQYSDYRHPDSVCFTDDIMDDLKRRDFTINAIAWNKKGLKYIPGTLDDLKLKSIRAVGDAKERFMEDPLRMMRAVRFSVQLNAYIANRTFNAITWNDNLIDNIAKERIQDEFNKILLSDQPYWGIYTLHRSFLLKHILPELINCLGVRQGKWHNADVYTHILRVLQEVPKDLTMRLAALLHDIGKPKAQTIDEQGHIHFYRHDEYSAELAKEILTRLKYDNDTINEVTYLVRYHMELMDFPTTDKGIRKLLNRHGESRLKKLIAFRRADLIGSGTKDIADVEKLINGYYERVDKVLQEKPPVTFDDLAINGNDIMRILNLQPCKEVGKVKQYLMETVLSDPSLNTKEQLEELLKRLYSEERMILD
jgi:putative nucleotidyltransferase with HDIG domain